VFPSFWSLIFICFFLTKKKSNRNNKQPNIRYNFKNDEYIFYEQNNNSINSPLEFVRTQVNANPAANGKSPPKTSNKKVVTFSTVLDKHLSASSSFSRTNSGTCTRKHFNIDRNSSFVDIDSSPCYKRSNNLSSSFTCIAKPKTVDVPVQTGGQSSSNDNLQFFGETKLAHTKRVRIIDRPFERLKTAPPLLQFNLDSSQNSQKKVDEAFEIFFKSLCNL
jgi:hypothetical protein